MTLSVLWNEDWACCGLDKTRVRWNMQMSRVEGQNLREAVRSELSLSSKCCLEQIVSTCQLQSAPQEQLRRTVQRAR